MTGVSFLKISGAKDPDATTVLTSFFLLTALLLQPCDDGYDKLKSFYHWS
jgi:hypothetical protein